jgi:hypothetical protein
VERSSTDSDPTIPNRNATAARTANALPTAGGFDVGKPASVACCLHTSRPLDVLSRPR